MYELPKLNYDYSALEPFVDSKTMEIHYLKHHLAYINKLNDALSKYNELFSKSIEDLISNLNELPSDIIDSVKNNGGGHYNHSLFWNLLKQNSGEPNVELLNAINQNFGDFKMFKEKFTQVGLARFGSGWVWLIKKQDSTLQIVSTPNQDNPLMDNLGKPILALDLWEHAYYLKYQNKRVDYIDAFWNIINWEFANKLFLK